MIYLATIVFSLVLLLLNLYLDRCPLQKYPTDCFSNADFLRFAVVIWIPGLNVIMTAIILGNTADTLDSDSIGDWLKSPFWVRKRL